MKTTSLATAGMVLYASIFQSVIHGRVQNKYRFHIWDFYIPCSAETHFFKWQGERKRIHCLHISAFNTQHSFSFEFERKKQVVMDALMALWLIIIIKSQELCWFAILSSFEITGMPSLGFLTINTLWSSFLMMQWFTVLYNCWNMVLLGNNLLFKDK